LADRSLPAAHPENRPASVVERFLTLPPLDGPLAPAPVRLGLVLLVVVIRVPSLFEPRWYSDEGFFTTVAWATARGVPLYSGVYDNQPPVIFWLYRLTQALGSLEHHSIVQLTATAAVALVALLTFEVSRRLTGQWAATLAAALTGTALSLPVLDGDLLNVELAALPFFLAALLLAFSPRGALVLASGALLGVAIATRPSFALDGFALAIPLLSSDQRLRRLCLAACGVLLSGGVVAAGWHPTWRWSCRPTMPTWFGRTVAVCFLFSCGLARWRQRRR
jgi:4-amino-4-deoxy-L-arabinose transferase-like glycosyltransferase